MLNYRTVSYHRAFVEKNLCQKAYAIVKHIIQIIVDGTRAVSPLQVVGDLTQVFLQADASDRCVSLQISAALLKYSNC